MLKLLFISTLAVVAVGCIYVAFGFAGWYMVAAGYVSPGQAMWVDDLAPEPAEAIGQMAIGAALAVGASVVRVVVRRKLRARVSAA